jgi:hypothetical protein
VVLAVAFSGDLRKYLSAPGWGVGLLSAPTRDRLMPTKMAMRWAKSVAGASEKDAPELTRNQSKFLYKQLKTQ